MTMKGGSPVISTETLKYELEGRFSAPELGLGKTYISVRWEPGPEIVRVGACLESYDWDNRSKAITTILAFERDHADEFAVDFDVIPLATVTDDTFADV